MGGPWALLSLFSVTTRSDRGRGLSAARCGVRMRDPQAARRFSDDDLLDMSPEGGTNSAGGEMKKSPATVRRSRFAARARSRAAGLGVALLFAGGGVAYASGTGRGSRRADHSPVAP